MGNEEKLLIALAIDDLIHGPHLIGRLGRRCARDTTGCGQNEQENSTVTHFLFCPQAATRNEIRTRAGKSIACPSRVAGLKWICFAAWTAA